MHRAVSHERRAFPQDATGADCYGLVGEGEVLRIMPERYRLRVHNIYSSLSLSMGQLAPFEPLGLLQSWGSQRSQLSQAARLRNAEQLV